MDRQLQIKSQGIKWELEEGTNLFSVTLMNHDDSSVNADCKETVFSLTLEKPLMVPLSLH